MQTVDIYFDDLTDKAQIKLLSTFETTIACENWDRIPVFTVVRTDEEDDEAMMRLVNQQKIEEE
jgi:hypothetical protein